MGVPPDGTWQQDPMSVGAGVIRVASAPYASILVSIALLLTCIPTQRLYDGTSTNIAPSDIASVVLVAVTGYKLRERFKSLRSSVLILFGAVTISAVVATASSVNFDESVYGLVRYLQLFVLVPISVALAIKTRRDIIIILMSVLAVGVFQGAVGTVQYLTRTGASYQGEPIRAVGTFGAQEIIAMSLAVSYAILIAVAGAVTLRRSRYRVSLALIAILLLLPLIFSFSRGSLIATIVGALLSLAAHNIRLLVKLILAVSAVAISIMLLFPTSGGGKIADRIESITQVTDNPDESVEDRYGLWITALNIFVDHPFTGGGLRSFATLKDSYAPLGLSSTSDTEQAGNFQRQLILSPHNEYLLVLSEQGLLGGLAFISLLGATTIQSLRRLKNDVSPVGAMAGLSASSLVVWQVVECMYGDATGASAVLVSAVLGLAVWWAFPSQCVLTSKDSLLVQ
jgi:O-antigen ligase